MRLHRLSMVPLGLGLLLLLASAGCIFSPDNKPPDDPVDDWSFPDTEDQLMANFKRAYSEMNIDRYRDVLNDNYKFMFQQEDIEHLGLPYDHFNRDDELDAATNMFTGVSPAPEVPAISSISIDVLEPQTAWQDVIEHPDFPNSRRRAYQITMYIERPGATTFKVEGLQEFFVVPHEFMVDNVARMGWQLVGQVDRTVGG